jgi:hypothetical protein
MTSIQSLNDGSDTMTGSNIVAIGGGGNDNITATGTVVIAGDYACFTNDTVNNGIAITSIAIINTDIGYNDIILSTSSNRIIIVGGNGDDIINITGANNNLISVCGDTCSISDSYTRMISVSNSSFDTTYGPQGSDQIAVIGSGISTVIVGGGGELDSITASGIYAVCGDHCYGNNII